MHLASFAIVPAAGRSERMGSPKLLLPWRGRPMIERTIAAWRAGGISHVVVVVRPGDAQLAHAAREAGADLVTPAVAPPEMKDSVQVGLAHVAEHFQPGPGDAWLLAPADMPELSQQIVARLLARHDPAAPCILAPTIAGRRGHPVLFPWPLAAEVARLEADEGLNLLIARQECTALRRQEIPCDDLRPQAGDPFADIDTPEEYRRCQDE